MALRDGDGIRLVGEGVAEPEGAGVGHLLLGLEAGQDGVVAGDGVDAPFLERDQAVGAGGDRVDLGGGYLLTDVGDGGRTLGRTDRAPGQVGEGVNRRVDRDEHVLVRLVVDGREVHFLPPVAGRGEQAGHHVDLAAGDRVDTLRGRERGEREVTVIVAEDGRGDRLEQVDVEPLDVTALRVAKPPIERALVDPDLEHAVLQDVVHRARHGHCSRHRQRLVGPEAPSGVGTGDGSARGGRGGRRRGRSPQRADRGPQRAVRR